MQVVHHGALLRVRTTRSCIGVRVVDPVRTYTSNRWEDRVIRHPRSRVDTARWRTTAKLLRAVKSYTYPCELKVTAGNGLTLMVIESATTLAETQSSELSSLLSVHRRR